MDLVNPDLRAALQPTELAVAAAFEMWRVCRKRNGPPLDCEKDFEAVAPMVRLWSLMLLRAGIRPDSLGEAAAQLAMEGPYWPDISELIPVAKRISDNLDRKERNARQVNAPALPVVKVTPEMHAAMVEEILAGPDRPLKRIYLQLRDEGKLNHVQSPQQEAPPPPPPVDDVTETDRLRRAAFARLKATPAGSGQEVGTIGPNMRKFQ